MTAQVAVEPGQGTQIVLARVTRPYDPSRFAAALLGLPLRAARQIVGAVLATSDEAEDLLDAMPRIVRSMAIATTDRPERCHGELRGPVLWSETMSVRSASAGDPGLFVCATTTKAYDTDENRVLKAALAAIERAGRDATYLVDLHGDERLRRARHNEHRARHLLEHRTLSAVPITLVSGRAIKRTRAGSRRNTYQPAIAFLARSHEPVQAVHLQSYAPQATVAEHDLLATVLTAMDARTAEPIPLRNAAGGLEAGPVRYDHLGGVTVGDALITDAAQIPSALDAVL
ncbi:MAG: hypothetical protein ACT4OV_12145 [Microthrixaceae bacterium]